ncbi:MAG: DUF5996 family protein [Gammaproteobacteria bacterium]|nr:DUF5996 family protein [Gammaproteobacteria bacterium]
MTTTYFPVLTGPHWPETRDAIHAYSKVLGAYCKALAPKQKHRWHVALQPSAQGLRSGTLRCGANAFEITLCLMQPSGVVLRYKHLVDEPEGSA